MRQLNSLIASVLVSGLMVAGMIGIGVNALTTPGAAPNAAAAQVTSSSNGSPLRQFTERSTRSTTGRTSAASTADSD